MRTVFINSAPNPIFGVGKTRHFKCHVLIDTEVYWCINDRLLQKSVQGHVTSVLGNK